MTLVLLSIGVTAGLMSVFAALLLVAQRYLVNYGRVAIDVNRGEQRLELTGGDTLLMSLRGQGIYIPSACGGKGTCAYCKVKIVDGGPPMGPAELPLLTDEEVADNVRISCQCKVRNDLAIEIPEQLLFVKAYRGVVEKIRDLTHDIKELRIRLTDPETIDFAPGQYVQLEAPAYSGNPEAVFRAYSVSSQPADSGYIELIIRLTPGGICTTWVFEHLKEGVEVDMTGPYGDFELSDSGRQMVWIAGGSGMAPFWSIVRYMQTNGITRPTKYFFGAVNPDDLFLVDELNKIAADNDWFEFFPALSGDLAEGQWSGETGLITEVLDRHVQTDRDYEAYLCGGPGMIDAAIAVLKNNGLKDDRIYFDKFA